MTNVTKIFNFRNNLVSVCLEIYTALLITACHLVISIPILQCLETNKSNRHPRSNHLKFIIFKRFLNLSEHLDPD